MQRLWHSNTRHCILASHSWKTAVLSKTQVPRIPNGEKRMGGPILRTRSRAKKDEGKTRERRQARWYPEKQKAKKKKKEAGKAGGGDEERLAFNREGDKANKAAKSSNAQRREGLANPDARPADLPEKASASPCSFFAWRAVAAAARREASVAYTCKQWTTTRIMPYALMPTPRAERTRSSAPKHVSQSRNPPKVVDAV